MSQHCPAAVLRAVCALWTDRNDSFTAALEDSAGSTCERWFVIWGSLLGAFAPGKGRAWGTESGCNTLKSVKRSLNFYCSELLQNWIFT